MLSTLHFKIKMLGTLYSILVRYSVQTKRVRGGFLSIDQVRDIHTPLIPRWGWHSYRLVMLEVLPMVNNLSHVIVLLKYVKRVEREVEKE